MREVYELERLAHMVHLASEGTLPMVFWVVLRGGGTITIAFSYVLAMDNARVHALLSGGLAAILASLLLLILAMNYRSPGPCTATRTLGKLVELRGFEPLTPRLPALCSPN